MTRSRKARDFGIEFYASRVSESLVESQTLTTMGNSVHCISAFPTWVALWSHNFTCSTVHDEPSGLEELV